MKLELIDMYGIEPALFGIGLSHGLTSGYEDWASLTPELRKRLYEVAEKLAPKDGGHNKFLRQIVFWWDATFSRFLWQEVDQYRIGVTTQSESTMHTIMLRELTQEDFEYEIHPFVLGTLNGCIEAYRMEKSEKAFLMLKNSLPEGFLQRRIWTLSLANMKNIFHQRKSHRLPQWRGICEAFVEATPSFLRGIYD